MSPIQSEHRSPNSPTGSGPPCIYLLYASYLANALTPLARQLKREGYETVLICYHRDALPNPKVYDFDSDAFAEIVELDPVLRADPEVGRDKLALLGEEMAQIERRYGISVTEILRTDRHVGIGWVTGAQFPQSQYGRKTSYPQTVDVIARLVRFFERLIERRPPSALVGISSAIGPATVWQLLKSLGIPVRQLTMARSGRGLYWSENEFMVPMGFKAAYQQALESLGSNGDVEASTWLSTSYRAQSVMNSMRSQTTWRHLGSQLYKSARTLAGDKLRRQDRAYGKYMPLQQFGLIVDRHFWRKRVLRERPVMNSLPEGAPFVFFPLQIEPESTLMLESPMCDSHSIAIDWLAKTAPGGWYVVVKEHPGATAPRSPGFHYTLSRYPNVIVASTLEDSRMIAERARAVAVLNGSLGIQAATVGKPVITFHPEFIARAMPHVLFADSYATVGAALRRIRDDDLPAMAERLRAARAFTAALDVCQFPVADPQILEGVSSSAKIASDDIDRIARTLLATLPSRLAKQSATVS